ncbi:MAG: four-helix bundle copper-binding protein [Dehalococcoidia bacterium]
MNEFSDDDETPTAMDDCIDWCARCHDICLQTVNYCLGMGGEHASQDHIRLLLDCAQICRTSADFMLRESSVHGATCAACAAVCDRCAEDCERFEGDEIMQACAETCRGCAEACREMARLAKAA